MADMNQISKIAPFAPVSPIAPVGGVPQQPFVNDAPLDKSFASVLKRAVDEVNLNQQRSEQALADVATGQIKDLHQAAIAIGKAENSMKLMLEVRNKAISAYKEILRTQI
ncbi:MAG: flagellar hook-basal body complex protein FliE [Helicobacter sp.]|nr:flagellar hook-basal body complex protein FliE [Helicobacter sp.]MDE7254579.1 flagellar hook-basal body complex protein FliE [Helicobacter sp.]MDE7316431.1 flagellar hook-basal body complex protein FliE [Helicobacter sp.]